MKTDPKIIENAQRIAIGESLDLELTDEEIAEVLELARHLYCPSCG